MPRLPVCRATLATCLVFVGGCISPHATVDDSMVDYQAFLKDIEYPDAEIAPRFWEGAAELAPPPTVRRVEELEFRPLSFDEAVRMALENSETIRDIGGRVVASPASVSTIYDPAILETDPRTGPEAALAAFDAQFAAQLAVRREEAKFNRRSFSGFLDTSFGRTVSDFGFGFAKVAATGTQLTANSVTRYERSNASSTLVPDTFDTRFQVGFRHPLLRGSGIEFNRIAGPGATPGSYRGILIARINSDVALADFEASVRNLVRDVERAYWALYFAYRDLDAKVSGRGYALESWEFVKQRADVGTLDPDQEALARQQYYLAQSAVENSLSGRDGVPGVFNTETRLRSLLGLPASDGRLIRPSTKPLRTDVRFDWEESLDHALVRRVELRKQRWSVKRRELELVAARNFGRMQLDFTGGYQIAGFNENLMGPRSAFADMFQPDLEGWYVGFEMNTPVGNRLGHAAIRNAELWLRREQALVSQQELEISYQMRDAFTELDRAYVVARSNYNRYVATQFQLQEETKRYVAGDTELNFVLDAQRRAVESEINFHRAIVDYNLALANIHFTRGTLLDSFGVYLTEGPWSEQSHALAIREARRYRHRCWTTGREVVGPVSAGAYAQRVADATYLYEPPLPGDEIPLEPEAEDIRRLPSPADEIPPE